MPPAYEPDHKPHPQHTPKDPLSPKPVDPDKKPQADKTAGDLRKEDAEVDTDQLQAEKQGIQDVADDKAMADYKAEQVAEFPPEPSDPLKDREARRAEDKKHHHGDKPSNQQD